MAANISHNNTIGKTLFASLERVSDGYFWDENTDEAWQETVSAADKKISLTEGTSENVGSYTGSNSGDLGNAGLVRIRIHDDDNSDIVIGMAEVEILGGNEVELGSTEKLLYADKYIDTATTPWQLVYIQQGTGNLSTGTELLRQDLKTTGGADITDSETIVGQHVET